jgi:hypothetical protein
MTSIRNYDELQQELVLVVTGFLPGNFQPYSRCRVIDQRPAATTATPPAKKGRFCRLSSLGKSILIFHHSSYFHSTEMTIELEQTLQKRLEETNRKKEEQQVRHGVLWG